MHVSVVYVHAMYVCCVCVLHSVYVKTEGHTVSTLSEQGALGFLYSTLGHFVSLSAYQNENT